MTDQKTETPSEDTAQNQAITTPNTEAQTNDDKNLDESKPEGLQIVDNPNVAEAAPEGDEELTTEERIEYEINEDNCQIQDGDKIEFVRVRFPGNAKSFPFLINKNQHFNYGQKVLAMSDRGVTVGYVNSFPYEMTFKKNLLPLKTIHRIATAEDFEEQKSFEVKEKEAEVIFLNLIDKHQLDMVLTHVELIQFGKKAVFYFNAPARVDFRQLVKDLVNELKMRIELRQISVRDRAAALGGVGACGRQTCCSSFLKNYGNVSIKMAKNQNLALIPTKINGICGQVKCCIKYEDSVYQEKRKKLPREGTMIETGNGDRGKVLKLHILIEQFEMLTEKGQRRKYSVNQFDPERKLPKEWAFPESFRHIVNEMQNVIGVDDEKLKELEEIDRLYHEGFIDEMKTKSKTGNESKDVEVLPTASLAEAEGESTDKKRPPRSGNRNRNRNRSQSRSNRSNQSKADGQGQKSASGEKKGQKRDNRKADGKPNDNRRNNSKAATSADGEKKSSGQRRRRRPRGKSSNQAKSPQGNNKKES